MKVAFVFGAWAIGGRYFDFSNLWGSPRGLTGSELAFFRLSQELAARGHDVHAFIFGASKCSIDGVQIWPYEEFPTQINELKWDVAYAWAEADLLRCVPPGILRMVNQQLNDFVYCYSDFDTAVDIYTSPSESHCDYIKNLTPSPHKWRVVHNGCDPDRYKCGPKVPGRIIWASSPDRGLHLLLQHWSTIRRAVPEAHLKIFYHMDTWIRRFSPIEEHDHPVMSELGCRARYVDLALKRLNNHGIEKCGSVSRQQMLQEMDSASVLAYPCDTVSFTEGFSVTIMEACAAGVVPIISNVDSLEQIYGVALPMIKSPARDNMGVFVDYTIRALTDLNFRTFVTERARTLANRYTWSSAAAELEKLIIQNVKR